MLGDFPNAATSVALEVKVQATGPGAHRWRADGEELIYESLVASLVHVGNDDPVARADAVVVILISVRMKLSRRHVRRCCPRS